SAGDRFVLKIAHAEETEATLDLQHRALERIAEREPTLALPRLLRSRAGRELETVSAEDGTVHLARVLTWVPGREWARTAPHTPELLTSLGRTVARIDRALEGFAHVAARRELKWDIARSGWIGSHLTQLTDPTRRALVERHLTRFESEIQPGLSRLRRGVIHNDSNDWNVIVAPGHPDTREVSAIVDFGDMLESVVVADLAIACAYAMQDKPDPLAAATAVVAGYHAEYPLQPGELALLFPLIGIRLAVSVVNSAEQAVGFPGDSYLTISETGAWATLERLEQVHPRFAH